MTSTEAETIYERVAKQLKLSMNELQNLKMKLHYSEVK